MSACEFRGKFRGRGRNSQRREEVRKGKHGQPAHAPGSHSALAAVIAGILEMREQVWEVETSAEGHTANRCSSSSAPHLDSNPRPILMLVGVQWSALSPCKGRLAFLLDTSPSPREISSRLCVTQRSLLLCPQMTDTE